MQCRARCHMRNPSHTSMQKSAHPGRMYVSRLTSPKADAWAREDSQLMTNFRQIADITLARAQPE